MMKKIMLTVIIVICAVTAYALEVDKTELESAGTADSIVFINYTGPHAVINTADQIKSIGSSLSPAVTQNNLGIPGSFGNRELYYVIHAVDPSVKEKLDADILILGPKAGVDHIRNLRRILSSYLSAAYGYTEKDAETLSVFITVYNAVYRSKMDVFTSKYKTVVMQYLESSKAGLSVNYEEWPGKTQIVIPLSDLEGGLGTIDTSIISDKQVVSSMQETETKEIDARKDMVDIKEREAQDAQKSAADAQKAAADAQKKAAEEEAKRKVEEEKLKKAEADALAAQKKADENPGDEQAQKEAEDKQKEAEAQKETVEKQEDKVAEAKEEAEALKTTAKEEQVIADKKTSEAQTDRISIAKDQQELLANADLLAVMDTTYGLKLIDQTNLLSAMVLFDVETGKVVKESPVNVIRNRQVVQTDKGFIAIAGKTGGNAAVKLVILDSRSMEIIKESSEIISEKSMLAYNTEFVFAVMESAGKWYLGRYTFDLALSLKSDITVDPASPIVISEKGISVTSSDGLVTLLASDTLKAVKE
ncbi:MAG TPA: P83/100 family protein [Treponemataceae bacterium]|nr:P83/100 family protein [Treponemataceae bacterium]HQL03979.1 P83/100 family protein [Treponemataceae bacterium]